MVIIFWDFLMFNQNIFLAQAKPNVIIPADTDVLRTSWKSRDVLRPNQTSSRHLAEDVWFKMFCRRPIYVVLRRPIYNVLKMSDLLCLEDVWFTLSWRRLTSDVLKTSDLRCLKDVGFMLCWWRLMSYVLKTSDLRHFEDVQLMLSCRRLIYNVLKTCNLRRLENV